MSDPASQQVGRAVEPIPATPTDWQAEHTDFDLRIVAECALAGVADEIALDVLQHLDHTAPRQRKRKADVERRLHLLIESFIANSVRALHRQQQRRIGFGNDKLNRRDRYRASLESPIMPAVFHALVDLKYLDILLGQNRWFDFGDTGICRSGGRQTLYSAGPRLMAKLTNYNITTLQSDLYRDNSGREVILLRDQRTDYDKPGDLLQYPDSQPEANLVRPEVRCRNAFIHANRHRWRYNGNDPTIDDLKLEVHQVFTQGQWDRGGRYHGPYYQQMTKLERLRDNTIDGQAVAEVDFSATVPRLAYAKVGVEPPACDLYDMIQPTRVNGVSVKLPREVKKGAALALLNGATNWPKRYRDKHRPNLRWSAQLSWERWKVAFFTAHPALKPLADRGVGEELTRIESSIMARVLARLNDEHNIAASLIFDCCSVVRSRAPLVASIMLEEWRRTCGYDGRVTIETLDTYLQKHAEPSDPVRAVAA